MSRTKRENVSIREIEAALQEEIEILEEIENRYLEDDSKWYYVTDKDGTCISNEEYDRRREEEEIKRYEEYYKMCVCGEAYRDIWF